MTLNDVRMSWKLYIELLVCKLQGYVCVKKIFSTPSEDHLSPCIWEPFTWAMSSHTNTSEIIRLTSRWIEGEGGRMPYPERLFLCRGCWSREYRWLFSKYLVVENNFETSDFSLHFHRLLSTDCRSHECWCLFRIVPITGPITDRSEQILFFHHPI